MGRFSTWRAAWKAKLRTTPPTEVEDLPTSTTTPDEVAARVLAAISAPETFEQPEQNASTDPDSQKGGPTMRYPDKHYEKVAKLYLKHGSVAKVQNHFPNYSESSVRRWVAECRKRGLLPEKPATTATAKKKPKR